MFHPLPLWLGLRYTGAKRRNHFISFISVISMAGIFVGVTALITVLSVMNGFEKELRERILGVASHASVTRLGGPLEGWQQVAQTALGHPEVVGAAPYVEGQVMLVKGQQVTGAQVRGVLPEREPEVSEVDRNMEAGRLDELAAGEFGIVLGSELARYLGVGKGDRVTVVTPEANVTPAGVLPRLKRFTVAGVFEIGMYDYDRSTAFIHIEDARTLMRMDQGVSGVRLRLSDMFLAPRVADAVEAELGRGYWVRDWTRRHASFFQAVRTEKTVMFVILTLIVAVAAFNIVSTLVMMVTDKQADIAILRTLGLTPGGVMGVFLVQGSLIGVIGTALGVGGGVALALNIGDLMPALEQLFGVNLLPADVYYISDLPSDLQLDDVLRITGLSLVLSVVATLYPARRAARTQPAEALRYE
ncbi:MAG: lipoprotein-releasing ABC transporter permease subunit [Halofilum sp. (in: g-proteobacteria)]|nr:lipoprotein-releasing ABC transporter permease subunit [Halofilum sp. (in: g-proteobacteria)]